MVVGIFVAGELIPGFWNFYIGAGAKGRYMLSDWLGVDPGYVVLGMVLMAVMCFFVVERVEKYFTARKNVGVEQ